MASNETFLLNRVIVLDRALLYYIHVHGHNIFRNNLDINEHISTMDKEKENFYRIITLILDQGTKATRELLKCYLETENITLQYFLSMHLHTLYHLYYNTKKCCKCIKNYKLPQKRILNLVQLEILFDQKSTRPAGSSSLQCNTSGFCCCQVTTKSTLTVDQLDFTLTRCLLINCCEKLFWDVSLAGSTLEFFLNNQRHDIFHLWQTQQSCCHCHKDYNPPGQGEMIKDKQWLSLFSVTSLQNKCPACGSLGNACCVKAIAGISLNSILSDESLRITLLKTFCPLRQDIDKLADFRNIVYGHALEVSVSDEEYEDKWLKIKACLMALVKQCGSETEQRFQDNIENIRTGPIERTLYLQYHTDMLREIKENSNTKQEIMNYLKQTTDQISSKIDKLQDTTAKSTVQTYSQCIQTDSEDKKGFREDFYKLIEEKEQDLVCLDKAISDSEAFKIVHEEQVEKTMQKIKERSSMLQAAIKERETELLEELMVNQKENLQTVDKICKNYVKLKQNNVKQISNYKKMTSALQDDDELTEQFVKDSTPKLEALSTSLTTTFPLPLTFSHKPPDTIKNIFGTLSPDFSFGPCERENNKYRTSLDVINKFKVERDRTSVYSISIRPDGKAWISTANFNLFLVKQTGEVIAKQKLDFDIFQSACNRKGNLLCINRDSNIREVRLEQITYYMDFTVYDFENMSPYCAYGLHINKDDCILVLLCNSKRIPVIITIFSNNRMRMKDIPLEVSEPPNSIDPWSCCYITQNSKGQIFTINNHKLMVIEPCGLKYNCYQPADDTWEGKGLIIDPFDNLISSENPKDLRHQNIHITNSSGQILHKFTIEGPDICGMNNFEVDYQNDEPVLWMCTTSGHVIIAKFINKELLMENGVHS